MGNTWLRAFKPPRHRHADCVSGALAAAERSCAVHGQRLTELRRRVLELVWESHRPIKAYDVLARLQQERNGAAPPTVYRALEFLRTEGLVHRIESLNAFVGCGEPARAHTGQFLICRRCGAVAEMDDAELSDLIAGKAGKMGFRVDRETIEIEGVCGECAPG
jgi:Fur family zinc uptake transcriptional regulator